MDSHNEVSGTVRGPVVQAGVITGGVHLHLPGDAGRRAEVDRARRHVAEGDHLASRFTGLTAFLHRRLLEAQEDTVRLTWERDHRLDDGHRREEAVGRARDAERRTARQLDRAAAARLTALRLALAARDGLRQVDPGADDVAEPPADPPPDSELDPDGVDRWLEQGTGGVQRLARALGEPLPGKGAPADVGTRPGDLLGPLVDALAAVPLLANTANRTLVVQLLGQRSGVALSVPESPHPRVHVSSIVLACLAQAGGIDDLLGVLEILEPGTLPLAEVRLVVARWRRATSA
ncbi:hypothetical protein IOD16_25715 [Saccharothrix sp. 6-C]|uniref:effector-associated domain 2-containing protein n=1 Tax=Saccharothrix sp. 6-C TaxID=2781735 RepID=UPI001916F7E8|nr:hypothetical protein [Saccharothrix sp. 6-C]QQQ74540.1 hypothetical protein IOD16_25715 [Saccharothrix sp. 6-C]